MSRARIPVVDLFAGPGGLGEGFAAVRDPNGHGVFDIRLSIEKDSVAHRTLSLRSIFRTLSDSKVPDIYYDYLRGDVDSKTFLSATQVRGAAEMALKEAHCLELGLADEKHVDALIKQAIGSAGDWVLIGGPPCQAYSMAGRSRRKRVDPGFEDDPKHFLYREYLRIIREFRPAVFVMENVKGMLSSTHNGQRIFERIISDLSEPAPGIYYDIRSFVNPSRASGLDPDEFTIQSEDFGIPQMRHRVILLGIRSDRAGQSHRLLSLRNQKITVRDAIFGLPSLRSRLSQEEDSPEHWLSALRDATKGLKGWRAPARLTIESLMSEAIADARKHRSTGASFIYRDIQPSQNLPSDLASWLHDPKLGGVCQHETRSHMRSDLHRYLFASCFAKEFRYSPKLSIFPRKLLPNHKNVDVEAVPFEDRFRVQLSRLPSTTIVSHIAKDGHYYIHPEPSQCRSLTVREAARLQTFPDNYLFEGNRTQQYQQVGNAVPPFLAKQLGEIVADFLDQKVRIPNNKPRRKLDLFSEI